MKLFASIIRKDGDQYFLVTPVEKAGIKVDDAPFVAVDFDVIGSGPSQEVTFTTNVEDETTAGPERPVRVVRDPETGEVSPYVLVRANLEALIDRKSFYRLVDICVHETREGESWFGLWSKRRVLSVHTFGRIGISGFSEPPPSLIRSRPPRRAKA